jgi:hypothetical protein
MVDVGTITTLAVASAGALSTVAGWAIKTYVTGQIDSKVVPLEKQIGEHEAEDRVMHTFIKESLERIEKKLDADDRDARSYRRDRP